MLMEKKVNFPDIFNQVEAAEHLQDAGKLEEAVKILVELGKELTELEEK